MSYEGCLTFIIHYFVGFMSQINPYLKRENVKKAVTSSTSEYKTLIFNLRFLRHFSKAFHVISINRNTMKRPHNVQYFPVNVTNVYKCL